MTFDVHRLLFSEGKKKIKNMKFREKKMTDEPRECNIQTTGGELEVNKSQRIIILLKGK